MVDFYTMDHDHGMMNHTNGSMPMHMNMNMTMTGMYFHFSADATILFGPWKVDTPGGMFGSMVAVALLAFLFEAIRVWRLKLAYSALLANPVDMTSTSINEANMSKSKKSSEGSPLVENEETEFEIVHKKAYKMQVKDKLVQGLLQMVMVALGYFLMLVFMTYNVWLCFAVIIGFGSGYAATYRVEKKYAPIRSLMEGAGECHV